MKKIAEDNITYGESIQCSRNSFAQDIYLDNKIIGALISIRQGFLEPIKERYQMLIKEFNLPENVNFNESEDDGCVFAYTDTLEEFLLLYKKVRK